MYQHYKNNISCLHFLEPSLGSYENGLDNAVSQIASLYAQMIDKLDQSSGAVQLIPAGLSDSNEYWKSHLGLCHYSALSQVYAKGDAKRRKWMEDHRIVFCIKDKERYAAFVRSWGVHTLRHAVHMLVKGGHAHCGGAGWRRAPLTVGRTCADTHES